VEAQQQIKEAAIVSRLAYDRDFGPGYLAQFGHHGYTAIEGPLGALALCSMNGDTAWVSFAGTKDPMDLTVDLLFVPWPRRPQHSGFLLAWRVLREAVETWLRNHEPKLTSE